LIEKIGSAVLAYIDINCLHLAAFGQRMFSGLAVAGTRLLVAAKYLNVAHAPIRRRATGEACFCREITRVRALCGVAAAFFD